METGTNLCSFTDQCLNIFISHDIANNYHLARRSRSCPFLDSGLTRHSFGFLDSLAQMGQQSWALLKSGVASGPSTTSPVLWKPWLPCPGRQPGPQGVADFINVIDFGDPVPGMLPRFCHQLANGIALHKEGEGLVAP